MRLRRLVAAPFEDGADRRLDLVLHADHAGIEFRRRRQRPAEAAARLRGADDVEVLDVVGERAAVDLDDVAFHVDQPFGKKREFVVEAGGGDDHVVVTRCPVAEINGFALEAVDLGARMDQALAQVVEQVGAVGRVPVEDPVVGLLEPVTAVVANGRPDDAAEHEALERDRQPPDRQVGERTSERGLREEPVARPQAQVARAADAGRLAGDIVRRVASPDHQDALVLELFRAVVILGMNVFPGERAGDLGKALCPVVTVADHDALVRPNLAVLEGDGPAVVWVGLGARHGLVEFDVVGDPAVPRIGLEIRPHLLCAWEVRIVVRHRVVREGGRALRRDDVRGIEHALVPVAPDAAVGVDVIVRYPGLL